MNLAFTLLVLIAASIGSFIFATLAYSLRDYSRATLGEWFEVRRRRRDPRRGDKAGESVDITRVAVSPEAQQRLEAVVEHEDELALTAAVARTGTNLVIVLAVVHLLQLLWPAASGAWVFAAAFVVSFALVGLVSVALPLAVSSHAAEASIGTFGRLLWMKRIVLWPVVKLHAPIDRLVRSAAGRQIETPKHVEQEIEKEILDIVAEGRSEGVIDETERQMIERALRFQDTTAGQAMTPRGDVVGLHIDASVDDVLHVIEETGYSRIPVYKETLDHVEGVLYARDLFRYVGKRLNGHDSDDGTVRVFSIADIMRRPLIIPETKPLPDLLRDMQLQKIHMAIVLDEYGGTSGLVTIEDVVEELVGEIEDEHDEDEGAPFDRIDESSAEADARVEVDELNRLMGLGLPEQEGFETLGGFITTTLGRIPAAGASFEHRVDGRRAVFTILDAEPQRVNRVRIELQDLEEPREEESTNGEASNGVMHAGDGPGVERGDEPQPEDDPVAEPRE